MFKFIGLSISLALVLQFYQNCGKPLDNSSEFSSFSTTYSEVLSAVGGELMLAQSVSISKIKVLHVEPGQENDAKHVGRSRTG